MGRAAVPRFLSALLALCAVTSAPSQTTSSEVSGTVVDPSSAIVAGAKVTLQNEATAEARVAITNEAGVFVFPAVVRGSYSLRVEAGGFKVQQQTGIILKANEKRSLGDIKLALGAASESVTVEAHAAQDDVMRVGQVQVRQVEAGGGRGKLQVLAEFFGAQAHA